MKKASFGYLIKEGFRNLYVNRLMSLASTTVLFSCLLIVGIALILLLNINMMIDTIDAQNVIMVYIEDGADGQMIGDLGDEIRKIDAVASYEFVSKDDAYEKILDEIGESSAYLEGLDTNPLPDAYRVTVGDMLRFSQVADELRELENVLRVRENSDFAEQLAQTRMSVTYISGGIIILLLIVSLFIISNTIKITMFNRRLEISIMKSVGATNTFIRLPFVIEGMLLGIISGFLAFFAVWGVYSLSATTITSMISVFGSAEIVPFISFAGPLLLGFLGIGVFTGVFGGVTSIGKYLKERKFVDIEEI